MGIICRLFGHKKRRIIGDCICANTVIGECISKVKVVKCIRCGKEFEREPHKHKFRKGSKILTDDEVKEILDAYKVG